MKKASKRKSYRKPEKTETDCSIIFYHTLREHWLQLPEPRCSWIDFVLNYYEFERYLYQWMKYHYGWGEKQNSQNDDPKK